jgi:hypothetical protein
MPARKRTESNGSLYYNILSENMNTSGNILLSDDRRGRIVPVYSNKLPVFAISFSL